MTWTERVSAVADHGFTERQAGFLVTVMLHSGACLGRNYSAFARIAHGGATVREFFDNLDGPGDATERRRGHNTAGMFPVPHKPLYEAIGEADNRNRRPLPLSRAI